MWQTVRVRIGLDGGSRPILDGQSLRGVVSDALERERFGETQVYELGAREPPSFDAGAGGAADPSPGFKVIHQGKKGNRFGLAPVRLLLPASNSSSSSSSSHSSAAVPAGASASEAADVHQRSDIAAATSSSSREKSRSSSSVALQDPNDNNTPVDASVDKKQSVDVPSVGNDEAARLVAALCSGGLEASLVRKKPKKKKTPTSASLSKLSAGEKGRLKKAALLEEAERRRTTFRSTQLTLLAEFPGYDNYHDSWTNSAPSGFAIHPETGDVYVADSSCHAIYRLGVAGLEAGQRAQVVTFAGNADYGGWGASDGDYSHATFQTPGVLALTSRDGTPGGAEVLLIGDRQHGSSSIRAIDLDTRAVKTLIRLQGEDIYGLTMSRSPTRNDDGDDEPLMFYSSRARSILEVHYVNRGDHNFVEPIRDPSHNIFTMRDPSPRGPFNGWMGGLPAMTSDSEGNLIFIEGHSISKLWRQHDWLRSSLAGIPGSPGYVDGLDGGLAQFDSPTGVAMDLDGSVLVADCRNGVVRRISLDPADGIDGKVEVSTVFDGREELPYGFRNYLRAVAVHPDGFYLLAVSNRVLRLERDYSYIKPARR